MKQLVSISLLSILSLATFSSQAQVEKNFHYDYATVLQVTPIVRIVETEQYESQCRSQRVIERQPDGKNKLLGSILGAAVGHALGSRSKHRKQATIVGAIAGASMASSGQVKHSRQMVCEPVPVTQQQESIVGYKVVYRYNDRTFETRLNRDPGSSLKLRVLHSPIIDNDPHNRQRIEDERDRGEIYRSEMYDEID